MRIGFGNAAAIAAAMLSLIADGPAGAQGWLFGQRRDQSSATVKVSGKYRKGDEIRVDAHGGPFDQAAVARAVIVRLAELTRDRGFARFVIAKESCWQNMPAGIPGTNHCWAIATMMGDEGPGSAALGKDKAIAVAVVLGKQPAAPER